MWKIAIIDDDRQVLRGMKQAIPWDELGAEWVGESTNGAAGIELIRLMQPDIVITDIYMPVMNGLEMIEALRQEQFAGRFLIHSGYSDFEYARKAIRMNVDDYLCKPVSRQTLHDTLSLAIRSVEQSNRLRMEQKELQDKVIRYEPFVHKEWLKHAITGNLDEFGNEQPMLGGEQTQSYLVIGIEIIRTARISDVGAPDRSLFRFAIRNMILEIFKSENYAFDYVELHGYHSALILYFDRHAKYEDWTDRVAANARTLIDSVGHYLSLSLRLGIGGLKNHWSQISDSFEEAFHFISLEKTFASSPSLYDYKDAVKLTAPAKNPIQAKPMRFYHQLIEDIKHTQGKTAEKIIRTYVSTLKDNQDPDMPSFYTLGARFWTIASYALNDEEIRLWEIFTDEQIEAELLRIRTAEEFAGWLNDKIRGICINQSWHENLKHKHTVDFIKDYIHENYAVDLTLGELAEKIYLSKNHLNIIFKNATGETINNYMIKVRMETAKALLMKGTMKIYEVAESVGYKNIPYFSTAFKKHFGFSPVDVGR